MNEVVSNNNKNAKLVAILAYFLIGIIWYFLDPSMKSEKLAKYHVKQSINLALFSLGFGVATAILSPILVFIPIIGWLALIVLSTLGPLFFLVIAIIGLVHAINGKTKPVPFIGAFADQYLKF